MRFILLILFGTICFSASAQWYRIDLKLKKHVRPEAIEVFADHSVARLPKATVNNTHKIIVPILNRTEYSYYAAEAAVIKTAQHNMRFRVYNDASYNFSELAHLYILQNRYAEAKWYLLQSNLISRDQNDDKHTIANLVDLATIKAGLGDFIQAQQDLTEACDMAGIKGYKDDVATIEKKLLYLKQNRLTMPKVDVRYAETPMTTPKAE
jgi:hypothetical protein